MKKILLINPNRMQPPIAPVGLEYIAGALASQGRYAPEICDLCFVEDWESALAEAIAGVSPDVLLISLRNLDDAYFASQDFILEKNAAVVRRAKALSVAPVILGGSGFSIAPEAALEFTGADYGVVGDGESGVHALLDCIFADGDPAGVQGAVFRAPDGRAVSRGVAVADLSALSAPSRRFFDNVRYFNEGGQLGIETKRGCGMPCVYCVEPFIKSGTVRARRPEALVAEVRGLVERGIDVFHLCDSEFNQPPELAHAFCAALRGAGLDTAIRWYAYCSPYRFDADLAKAMAAAGCAGVNFGVDHAMPEMLRRLGRPFGPDDILRTVAACRDAGFYVMFDVLLGSPGETRETLAETLRFMQRADVDRAGLSCGVRVYPNTALGARIQAEGVAGNPALHGTTQDNETLLRPVFYVSPELEGDIFDLVSDLIGDDPRFLHANPNRRDGNYNYNGNDVLVAAIRKGARGAYWDILRRIERGEY